MEPKRRSLGSSQLTLDSFCSSRPPQKSSRNKGKKVVSSTKDSTKDAGSCFKTDAVTTRIFNYATKKRPRAALDESSSEEQGASSAPASFNVMHRGLNSQGMTLTSSSPSRYEELKPPTTDMPFIKEEGFDPDTPSRQLPSRIRTTSMRIDEDMIQTTSIQSAEGIKEEYNINSVHTPLEYKHHRSRTKSNIGTLSDPLMSTTSFKATSTEDKSILSNPESGHHTYEADKIGFVIPSQTQYILYTPKKKKSGGFRSPHNHDQLSPSESPSRTVQGESRPNLNRNPGSTGMVNEWLVGVNFIPTSQEEEEELSLLYPNPFLNPDSGAVYNSFLNTRKASGDSLIKPENIGDEHKLASISRDPSSGIDLHEEEGSVSRDRTPKAAHRTIETAGARDTLKSQERDPLISVDRQNSSVISNALELSFGKQADPQGVYNYSLAPIASSPTQAESELSAVVCTQSSVTQPDDDDIDPFPELPSTPINAPKNWKELERYNPKRSPEKCANTTVSLSKDEEERNQNMSDEESELDPMPDIGSFDDEFDSRLLTPHTVRRVLLTTLQRPRYRRGHADPTEGENDDDTRSSHSGSYDIIRDFLEITE